MITTEQGPLWYRELLTGQQSDAALASHVDRILKAQQAAHIVVGHSVLPVISPRFGGKVIGIDVGLSVAYKGPPEFLLVEGSRFFVVCRGHRIDFPADGRNMTQYLRDVFAFDPKNHDLQRLVQLNT